MKSANIRTDDYGGSIENRVRFLFEVLDSIAEKVSLTKVGVRISPDLSGMFGIDKDDEAGQLYEYIVNRLNSYNLAYLHLSGVSRHPNPEKRIIELTKKYRSLYHGTLMVNGSFNKESAEQVLTDNLADLISFGIPFISNPDLV